MDAVKFAECCQTLYRRWEVDKTLGRGCDGIVMVASNRDDEEKEVLSKAFVQSAGMWQLRQSEWIMAFTEGCIFMLANSERSRNFIKGMVENIPATLGKRVEVLLRDKADKNKSNFQLIIAGLKASKRGSKVGLALREKNAGSFSGAWEGVLRESGLEVVDVTEDLWEVVKAHKRPTQPVFVAAAESTDAEAESNVKKRKAPEKPNKLQESLLRALECSVCMNIMVAPVFQCHSGHSICKTCVEKVSKCPMCRCEMRQRIRNLAIEQMAEGMGGFLCMHASQGCKMVVSYANLEEHQKSCGFGPVSCPWAWYRRTGPRPCGWQGPASALIEHLHCKHSERSSKLNAEPSAAHQAQVHRDGWSHRVLIQSPQQSYTANFEAIIDPKKPEEKVFFRMDHRGKEQMSFTCVRYIGVSPSAASSSNDWFCELTAGRYSKQDPAEVLSRRALWSGRVHSISHTPRELRDAGEGLFLQSSQVRLLAEKEKSGEGEGNRDGSVLIHLRFFSDPEAAGKLGLPPMTDKDGQANHLQQSSDHVTSESDEDEEDDDDDDDDDEDDAPGPVAAAALLHAGASSMSYQGLFRHLPPGSHGHF